MLCCCFLEIHNDLWLRGIHNFHFNLGLTNYITALLASCITSLSLEVTPRRQTFVVAAAVPSPRCVWLFATPWAAGHRASLPLIISWSLPSFMPIASWNLINCLHSISCWKLKLLVPQSCLTLCNPMDCKPPSPSVHGILQPRVLEWVAIAFSRGSSPPRERTQAS